jgi:starvation-inducible outer membrane lipoprotein
MSLQRLATYFTLVTSLFVMLLGCTAIPVQYVKMAEPGVTLSSLAASPESYRGKIVLMGGTIVEEEENAQYLWLRIKNRPLDKNFAPHLPMDTHGPEAGHYWVVLPKVRIPPVYRQWARITVVGRATGQQRLPTEPVLWLLYVRGWGMSPEHDAVWQDTIDPNYIPSIPAGIGGEFSPR